jgi:hypothetical protein
MTRKVTRRQVAREVNMMRNFRTATLSHRGENIREGASLSLPTDTQLPAEWQDRFIHSGAQYVVWSYDTPIAWWVPTSEGGPKETHGWVIPDVSYSVTTSRYQGMCNLAASLPTSDPYWARYDD